MGAVECAAETFWLETIGGNTSVAGNTYGMGRATGAPYAGGCGGASSFPLPSYTVIPPRSTSAAAGSIAPVGHVARRFPAILEYNSQVYRSRSTSRQFGGREGELRLRLARVPR